MIVFGGATFGGIIFAPSEVERGADIVRMAVDLDLRPPLRDAPLLVDEERCALDPPVLAPVHVLLLPDAVGLRHAASVIGQEWKVQVILLPEPHVAPRIVPAHAQDDGPLRRHSREAVAEGARLSRAP